MPQHRTSQIDADPLVDVETNTWTTLVVGLQQLPPNSDGLKLELPSATEDLDLVPRAKYTAGEQKLAGD